jgi:Glycosyl hydrolase family 47
MKLSRYMAVDGILGRLNSHSKSIFKAFLTFGFRNGWGATIVDGLSTLIIAGLETEALAALNHTVSIDFTIADGLVDPFETIIRYVFPRQANVTVVDM